MARIILSLFIALFSYSAHSQIISEIEGRLSVHPAGDITSQVIGDTTYIEPSGSKNLYIGHRAGYKTLYGAIRQTYVGGYAGEQTINNPFTTAVGAASAFKAINGGYNSFFGANSGGLSSGSGNTYLGYLSGFQVIGSSNILIGRESGPDLVSKTFSNRLYIHNSSSDYPLLYGEFDNGLLTVHHGNSETNPSSAEQGLRIQRKGTSLSWTQHVQSLGNLGFYYGGSGVALMTLQPDGTLIISGDIIADNVPTMSQIQDLKEENNQLKSQIQELTQMVKKLMPVESER